MLQSQLVVLDTAWPWANDTYGLCCLHAHFCVHKHTRTRSYPNRDSYGVLAANKNELAALSKGCRCWCWCCGPGCRCCELAERAFKTGRCHKLAVQAAYILAPASRMSTGRGILPSYLGLRWCNFLCFSSFAPDSEAMGFLLQMTMSCPCALSRQVAGAGAVSLRVWRQVGGAGAGCRVLVLVL